MIKYNTKNINDWNFGTSNLIKVYRNNAVCYYKVGGSIPTAQTPCFAVVDNISQYQETEFEDVFNKSDSKWYKLNNLNQYEEYGVYGSGRTITYYEGKLTVDDGYEYQYSGSSWVNVGEVSGSTATLPNVPFSVNYNAKNYDANTKTLSKTSGQLVDVDAVITAGTPTVNDGYLTIASGTRATISGYSTYFNRTSSSPNMTIISKQRTEGNNCHMFANRGNNYNWMYRCYNNHLTLHGSSETGQIAVTTQPVIESVRVNSTSPMLTYNNYTDSTSSTTDSFSYGSTNTGKVALFQGYGTSTGEDFVGDFYWVYMSQNTLTDEQVQQVIAYNEGGGVEYPMYYDEKSAPSDNVSFSSMTEAEEYECPWVGMTGIISNTDYIFDDNYDWITKYQWAVVPNAYICYDGDKYAKEQKQIRNVDDSWSDVSPAEYQRGSMIESASTDCQSRLPDGYTELEYVQNSASGGNTQRTDFFYVGFDDSVTSNASAYTYTIVGELSVGNTSAYWDFFGNSYIQIQRADGGYGNMFVPRAFGKTDISSTITFQSGIKYELTIYQGASDTYPTFVIKNVTASTTNSYSITSSRSMTNVNARLGLFNFYYVSDGGAHTAPGKIYSVTVTDRQGNLKCEAVPCRRESDGKIGMYNLARNEFTYDQSGLLTITGGPEV